MNNYCVVIKYFQKSYIILVILYQYITLIMIKFELSIHNNTNKIIIYYNSFLDEKFK